MVRVRTECCHGFTALTVVLVTAFAGRVQGEPAAMLVLSAAVLNQLVFAKDGVDRRLFDG
jgi:hypothetical protein